MRNQVLSGVSLLIALIAPAGANPVSRRAFISGGGGSGRCIIEVTVDRAAELEISGDVGLLTTLEGQPASWRRFQCNIPIPPQPRDFRVDGGGRGNIRLVQDPRFAGGRAVIRIHDPKGGRGNYSFQLSWRGGGFPPPRPVSALRGCREAVTDRLSRDGYDYITIDRMVPDDNPGRNDWITGRARGDRGHGPRRFVFSCSVDFDSGRVRSVDIRRSW